jgi:hypothetical protein
MVEISIETIGMERYVRGFNRIKSEVQDFAEPFRVILGDFRATEQRIFSSEGSSEGGPFVSLKEKYREWKDRNFPGRPIMVMRGDLMHSLIGKGKGTIENIGKTSAEFGTSIIYAHRHQVGYKMPKRKIVQLNEATKTRWNRIIARWANGLFAKHGIGDYTSYTEHYG